MLAADTKLAFRPHLVRTLKQMHPYITKKGRYDLQKLVMCSSNMVSHGSLTVRSLLELDISVYLEEFCYDILPYGHPLQLYIWDFDEMFFHAFLCQEPYGHQKVKLVAYPLASYNASVHLHLNF